MFWVLLSGAEMRDALRGARNVHREVGVKVGLEMNTALFCPLEVYAGDTRCPLLYKARPVS